MGRVVNSRSLPKRQCWTLDVRETPTANRADMLEWLAASAKRDVFWDAIQFRDPATAPPYESNRKRNFDDGYWVIRFSFTRKADAALFTLFWSFQ